MSQAQVRPRWSRSPVDDKTLEEGIGQFTFDLGIEQNRLNRDGEKIGSLQRFGIFSYIKIKNLWVLLYNNAYS